MCSRQRATSARLFIVTSEISTSSKSHPPCLALSHARETSQSASEEGVHRGEDRWRNKHGEGIALRATWHILSAVPPSFGQHGVARRIAELDRDTPIRVRQRLVVGGVVELDL